MRTIHVTQIIGGSLAGLVLFVIAGPLPPRARRATRPTRGSQERRLRAKRLRAQIKRGRSGDWD